MRIKNLEMSQIRKHRFLFGMIFCLLLMFVTLDTVRAKDYCIDCHSNPDLIVTNKKLYDYYKEWSSSIHKQEEVSCSDCHGGNPAISNKKRSHGGSQGTRNMQRAVNFRNIPKTCGQCHDDILDGYQQSNHFKHLAANKQTKQGPNCVTCHGSLNSIALNVNTVKQTCQACHNKKTANNPDVPEKAEWLLNKFLSIHRLFRYVTIKGNSKKDLDFVKSTGIKIDSLSEDWHTFNLKNFEKKTETLLSVLKEKRNELRKVRKKDTSSN